MKVYKRTFFSQILALLHQLRFFNYLTLGWDLALIRYCRRNRTKQEICGIPFYIVKLNQDLTLGLQFGHYYFVTRTGAGTLPDREMP
jgi:hypothetical protein